MKTNIILHEQTNYDGYCEIDVPSPSIRELLIELVNTPVIKIPFWILQHKQQLKSVGVELKEESK